MNTLTVISMNPPRAGTARAFTVIRFLTALSF